MRVCGLFLCSIGLSALGCSSTQEGAVTAPPCPTVAPEAKAEPPSDIDAPKPPASIAKAEGTVTVVERREDIALTGPRVDGKKGDLMIDNGSAVVVVTDEGRIADFGLRDERDEMVWLNPTVSVGLGGLRTTVLKLAAEDGGKAIRLTRMGAGWPVALVSWVWLRGKTLHVDSVAQSTGDNPALAITLGEVAHWGNVPTWIDGHGYIKEFGKLTGGFLARDALGVAYALCSNDGPLFARVDDQEYSGLFEPATTGEFVALVPAHGQSPPRSIVVTASTRSLGDAVMALPEACLPKGPRKKLEIANIKVPRASLSVVRCDDSGKPDKPFVQYRGTTDPKAPTEGVKIAPIELPEGCFLARIEAPGHAPGPWTDPAKLAGSIEGGLLPVSGTLSFNVTEGKDSLPARIVVRGETGTSDPDWGDNADGTGAATNVLATETGAGEVPLPPGKYRVLVNRGFEYTAFEQKIEIKAGKSTSITAKLDRVVDTTGWLAADLHLHAVPSPDAPSLLTDRIRSLVATGIEVAVATDHNKVTDYRPAIAEMGQTERIASVSGDEITTRDTPFGHFNAFPLDPATLPFKFKETIPSAIFADARSAKPLGKDTIVQVNHPRMGNIGYFEVLRFDRLDIPGWLKRSPLADMSFDAIEVFNGDHYTRLHKVEECLEDWYALLNAGYRVTATGNSDSHRVSFHEPGVPRNLVYLPDASPIKLDERAFADAVRGGHIVVSSGPFVTLMAGDKGVGDTIAPGDVELQIHVDGPAWVDIAEVTLVVRGESIKTYKSDALKGKRPYSIKHKVTLKKDDWLIALARGKKPMTYLYRSGAQPFAFTNPIFVE